MQQVQELKFVRKFGRKSYVSQGICARNGGINPMSASKVYLSVAMYGCRVLPISDDNVELIERAHEDAARRL